MVYKKYTYKKGKRFGPYLYENKRAGNKIITTYLGPASKTDYRKYWLYGILGFSILIAVVILLRNVDFRALLSPEEPFMKLLSKQIYDVGEPLSGALEFTLYEGELVPVDSIVFSSYAGSEREISFSEFVDFDLIEGEYFLHDTHLTGSGFGYGLQGKRDLYPGVHFKLLISESGEEEIVVTPEGPEREEAVDGEPSEEIEEENVTQESKEEAEEPVEETPGEEINAEEKSVAEEPSKAEELEEEPSAGEATSSEEPAVPEELAQSGSEAIEEPREISEDPSLSPKGIIVEGAVTAVQNDNFIYELAEGQTAEIVAGSVTVDGKKVADTELQMRIENSKVIITTEYFKVEKGFGKEFLGDETLKYSADLEQFGFIVVEQGVFSAKLVYNGEIIDEMFEEIVVEENASEINVIEPIVNETLSELNATIPEVNVTKITKYGAILGQPKLWVERFNVTGNGTIVVKLPKSATNVLAEALDEDLEEVEEELEKETKSEINASEKNETIVGETERDESIQEVGSENSKVQLAPPLEIPAAEGAILIVEAVPQDVDPEDTQNVQVDVVSGDDIIAVEYETAAPYSEEKGTEKGKIVKIVGPEDVKYENVLSFTFLPETFNVDNPAKIKIFWKEGQQFILPEEVSDQNSNGIYDYVSWIAPYLSNQTFEIIVIVKAEHLNETRAFVSDIYHEVKALDGLWSETIPQGHYVRVIFEKNLTSVNDITLYSRAVNGSPRIEVYESEGNETIAVFENLTVNEYDKVFLTNLQGNQDTFDLRVVDGAVEFDHIVDPFGLGNAFLLFYDGFEGGSLNCTQCGGRNGNNNSAWRSWQDSVAVGIQPDARTDCTGSSLCNGTYTLSLVDGSSDGNGGTACDGIEECTGVNHSIDTTGYVNISISFSLTDIENTFDALQDDEWAAQFSCNGGASWINLTWFSPTVATNTTYHFVASGINPCIDNNPNVYLRFWQDANEFVPREDSHIDDVTVTGFVKPATRVTLNTPANNSVFAIDVFNITLNASVYFDNNPQPLDFFLFGVKENDTAHFETHGVLLLRSNTSNGSEFIYNWTSPVVVPDNSTWLLFHFDNRSIFGENNTLVYDFAVANGTNNGTANGALFNVSAGKFAGAFEFDGVDDRIDVAQAPFARNLSSGLSAAAWIKPARLTGSSTRKIWSTGTSFSDPFEVQTIASSNTLQCRIASTSQSFTTSTSNIQLVEGKWYHVVCVFDRVSNQLKLYVNGALNTSVNTSTFDQLFETGLFRLGCRAATCVETVAWNGTIDELAIWNRSLSADEINDLYRLDLGKYFWKARSESASGSFNESEMRELRVVEIEPPIVRLISPTNGTRTNVNATYFYGNFSDNTLLINATLHVWNSSLNLVGTNFTNWQGKGGPGVNRDANLSITLPRDDVYFWNYQVYDSYGNVGWNHTNFTLVFDTTPPQVVINFPINGVLYTTNNLPLVFNVSLNEAGSSVYSLNFGVTNITMTPNASQTGFNASNNSIADGMYTFNVYANDTVGNRNYTESAIFEFENLNISSCKNLTLANARYELVSNAITNGTCFNVTADNIKLDGNGFSITGNQSGYGVVTFGRINATVKDLRIMNFSYGILFDATNRSLVQNVTIFGNTAAGIYLSSGYNNRVENSNLSNNGLGTSGNGLLVDNGANNSIVRNVIGSNLDNGILVSTTSNDTIAHNIISGNTQQGLLITSSSNTYAENNTIVSNAQHGIRILGTSERNVLLNNYIAVNSLNSILDASLSGSVNYLMYNNSNGEITWINDSFLRDLTVVEDLTFPGNVTINFNHVEVNEVLFSGSLINSSANVTLRNNPGTGIVEPALFRDGVLCSGICYNFTPLTAAVVVFNVSHWTQYSIGSMLNVTTCQELKKPNATYQVQRNISATGTCFNVTANNVTLDGQGYTVTGSNSGNGVEAYGRVNVTVKNISLGSFARGVYFLGGTNESGVIISRMYSNSDGIVLSGGRNTTVRNNTVNNNVISGIYLIDRAFNNEIRGNNITNNGEGIFLDANTHNNSLSNNVINSNSDGILLVSSYDNKVESNAFAANTQNSIYFSDSAQNTISSGSVSNSGQDAIFLDGALSDNNNFTNVTIASTNVNFRDIKFNIQGIDNTYLIDMPHIGNYTFTGVGGIAIFKESKSGEIRFLQAVNGSGNNLTRDVRIGNNSATVRSDLNIGLNQSANITLYGIGDRGVVQLEILRDGVACGTVCYNFTALNATNVIFNVSYWTEYKIGEGDQTPPNIVHVSPTPKNDSSQKGKSIFINVSANDSHWIYGFTNFDDSLVGWWRLDTDTTVGENATQVFDWSGKGNNGTVHNNVTPTAFGKFSSGFSFDGSSDYLNIPDDSSSLDFYDGGNYTWATWIKLANTGKRQTIFRKNSGANVFGYVIEITNSDDLVMERGDGSSAWTCPAIQGLSSDVWYHVAVVFETENKGTFYVDGQTNYTCGGGNFITDLTAQFSLSMDDSLRAFNGTIDEALFWNRSLSASEIATLYNASLPRFQNNYTNLSEGVHQFRSSVVDSAGNMNSTETRGVIIDATVPQILFVPPTPTSGSLQNAQSIFINVSANDSHWIYGFTNFDDSLVGWWRLDTDTTVGENATQVFDWSGKGNNGTVHNNATLDAGRFGNGFAFTGNLTRIRVVDNNSLDIKNEITVSVWVYPRLLSQGGDENRIVMKGPGSLASNLYSLDVKNNKSAFYLDADTGINSCNAPTHECVFGSSNVQLDKWSHLVGVFNGTSAFVYLNGVQDGSNLISNYTDGFDGLNDDLWIGGRPDNEDHFNGTIDEILLFNRSLSSDEVAALYNASSPRFKNNYTNLSEGVHQFRSSVVDSAGNMNSTEVRNVTIDATAPNVSFVPPTPASGTTTRNTSVILNASIIEGGSGLANITLNWNGTNHSIYDNSMVLMYNLNNVSTLGENNTFVRDASRYGNNGTVYGGAIWNATGKYSGAYMFDGIDDYINTSDSVSLNITRFITIEAWIKPEMRHEIPNNNRGVLAKASNPNWSWQLRFGHSAANGRLGFQFNNGSLPGAWVNLDENLTIGWWYYVVGVHNGTDALLYLNGVLKDTAVLSTIQSSSTPLLIGNEGWPGNFFNGTIDEVKIWNRSMNAIEIQQNYHMNLYRYDIDKWVLYVNQSNLSLGTYTYKVFAADVLGNANASEERNLTIVPNSPPNDPIVVINSTDGSNRTLQNLHCFATISDPDVDVMNVSVKWYNNSVEHLSTDFNNNSASGSLFDAVLGSGNTTKGQNWSCSMRLFDGAVYSNWVNSSNLTILNTPPSVTLLSPSNGNTTTDRTPIFNWNVNDPDNDPVTSEFNLTCYSGCSIDSRYIQGILGQSHEITSDLQFLIDDNYYYNWSVRANDSEGFGLWVLPEFRINIASLVSISLLNDTIDFGFIGQGATNDTTDGSPLPFLIENVGNVFVNVTANGTDLWQSIANPSQYYQLKVDNRTGFEGSFGWALSVTNYTLVFSTSTPGLLIALFNYTDGKDRAEIDVNITVPPAESSGSRSSVITFTASRSN